MFSVLILQKICEKNFEFSKENMDYICDFLNEISEDMRLKNRRVIVWDLNKVR